MRICLRRREFIAGLWRGRSRRAHRRATACGASASNVLYRIYGIVTPLRSCKRMARSGPGAGSGKGLTGSGRAILPRYRPHGRREGQMRLCLQRREFIAALGGASAWPLAAHAAGGAVGRVAYLPFGKYDDVKLGEARRDSTRPHQTSPRRPDSGGSGRFIFFGSPVISGDSLYRLISLPHNGFCRAGQGTTR
jgi:hypothetical protein